MNKTLQKVGAVFLMLTAVWVASKYGYDNPAQSQARIVARELRDVQSNTHDAVRSSLIMRGYGWQPDRMTVPTLSRLGNGDAVITFDYDVWPEGNKKLVVEAVQRGEDGYIGGEKTKPVITILEVKK